MDNTRFIVIDDDPVSNLICKLTVEAVMGKTDVATFINPQEGFDFVKSELAIIPGKPATLLLDINMPIMTGWEFLERFDELGDEIKENVNIYVLSSSVDPRDKERSFESKNVKGHLVKPLNREIVNRIIVK